MNLLYPLFILPVIPSDFDVAGILRHACWNSSVENPYWLACSLNAARALNFRQGHSGCDFEVDFLDDSPRPQYHLRHHCTSKHVRSPDRIYIIYMEGISHCFWL